MLIQVWTLPNCVQCETTKRYMTKLGIRYEEMQLENHPEMVEQFKQENLIAAPIVVTDTKKWSGFRLEKIKSLDDYLKKPKKLSIDNKIEVAIGLLEDDNLVWSEDFDIVRKDLAELLKSDSKHPTLISIVNKLVKED